jgi:hypothetical protein
MRAVDMGSEWTAAAGMLVGGLAIGVIAAAGRWLRR